jgi:hypothetical protein
MTERSVDAIASLEGLRVLRLGYVKFPLKSLARLKTMPNVERLGLEYCPDIGDDAIPHLVDWKSLKTVDLYGTKITAEGFAKLRRQRPDCKFLSE